jgi:hypothetical protein
MHVHLVSSRCCQLLVCLLYSMPFVMTFHTLQPPMLPAYTTLALPPARLFVLGGRTQAGPAEGAELLACFDTSDDRWRPSVPASGRPPCARSSHRAVAYGGHLLVCGGVTAEDGPGRLADVWVLLGAGGGGGQEGGGGGKMRWQQLAVPAGLTGEGGAGY